MDDGRVGDLVGTTWAALFLVSDEFADALRARGFSGWRLVPVAIAANRALPTMSMLQVVGRCGPISSPSIGRVLDPATWDGSDMFVPANEATILLSPRCADVLRQASLRNVEIVNAGLESPGS